MTNENQIVLDKLGPISNLFHEITKNVSFRFLKHSSEWSKPLNRILSLAIESSLVYKQDDAKYI